MIETRYHEQDGNLVIERVQEVDPVLESVKQHKEVQTGKPVDGLGYFAGRIPGVIVEKYMNEFGVSYNEFICNDVHIQRILNDPEYKRFRVWEGRI
ncbi:MAG: hypothetical protein GY954_16995 [Alteromonas sp.]|nr:hypothetical protein [Alteromonas sp.]